MRDGITYGYGSSGGEGDKHGCKNDDGVEAHFVAKLSSERFGVDIGW